jgi:hypothetical protein
MFDWASLPRWRLDGHAQLLIDYRGKRKGNSRADENKSMNE